MLFVAFAFCCFSLSLSLSRYNVTGEDVTAERSEALLSGPCQVQILPGEVALIYHLDPIQLKRGVGGKKRPISFHKAASKVRNLVKISKMVPKSKKKTTTTTTTTKSEATKGSEITTTVDQVGARKDGAVGVGVVNDAEEL